MEYYSAIKNNEILPFAETCLDLEGIMLSVISRIERDKCVKSKKCNKLVNITKKKQTHRYREQTSGYQWGRAVGQGNIGVGD